MRKQKKAGRKNKAVNQTERTDLTGIYITLLFILFPLAIHHGYTDILTVKTKYFLYSYRKLSVSYVYLLSDKRITYRKEILGQQVCVRFFCVGISGYGSYFMAL